MKSKLSLFKEGVSKETKQSQCENPFSEHDISKAITNASFSKVTVRRKVEKTLLKTVEEKDSVNSVTSTPTKQSYNCKVNVLDKKNEKKKKKEKSSGDESGLISDSEYDLFKPKKKKQKKTKSNTNVFLSNVELANDLPSDSRLKRKKKHNKLIGTEITNQTNHDEYGIVEVVSTSPTKSPKKFKSRIEDNELKCVVDETETTHSIEMNETNEDEECDVGNLSSPIKTLKNKKKQQKYFKDSDNTSIVETYEESDLKDDQENDTTRTLKKKKKRNKSMDKSTGAQLKNIENYAEAKLSYAQQTISSPKIKVEHKCIDLKTVDQETEVSTALCKVYSKSSKKTLGDDNENKTKRKKKIKNTYTEETDVANSNELITSSLKKKKKRYKSIDNSENVMQSNYDKHNIEETNNTSFDVVSPTHLKITSFSGTKSLLLKETSDGGDIALNKPEKLKKKKKIITELGSMGEMSNTNPKRNKKEKSSNRLKDDHQTSDGTSADITEGNNNAISSGETQLMDHKNEKQIETCYSAEKSSTDNLLGSEYSALQYKNLSTNPALLISRKSEKEIPKRKKQSKRILTDTDIITSRLLKNALKESALKKNLSEQKRETLKTEKKNQSSSLNASTLQDFSRKQKFSNGKQKSQIDLTRNDKKKIKEKSNKTNHGNEIENMKKELLLSALKSLRLNSVDKPSDPTNLKCTEEPYNSPNRNFTQTLHVNKSVRNTKNKPKIIKKEESVKKYSKLKKTKTKDPLEEITSKMLAEALARKKN